MAKKYTADTFEGDITGDVTGSASLNVLKAGDTMTGQLRVDKSGTQLQIDNSGDKFLEVNNFVTKIGDIDGVSDEGYVQIDGGNSEFILYQASEQKIKLDGNSQIELYGSGTNNANGAELHILKGQNNDVEGNVKLNYLGYPNDNFELEYQDQANTTSIKLYGTHAYFSSPLRIGTNSSANNLDDYEEGTYNIEFRLYRDANSDYEVIGSSGFAAWTNRSKYQKIGNTVTLFLDLEYRDGTSSKWNTSNTYFVGLSNLPFTYTQPATNTRVPVGGTYALRSTYQSQNIGQTIFAREGGYGNYSVYIAFGGILHSQYPNYALDPVYSNEWPQTRRYYYTEPVHLTGTVTYQTNQ